MVTSRSIEEIIENAVTSSIEHVFESGKLPKGLKKTVEAAVEKSAKKAIEQAEFLMVSSGPASSGPGEDNENRAELMASNEVVSSGSASSGPASSGTASSGRASSGPGEDNENRAELDETVVCINAAGRGVFHRLSCCRVKPTSRRFRACKMCFEQ